MNDTRLYFEDIEVGHRFAGATVHVEREQMLAVAGDYDDQAIHTDPETARRLGYDDVIASGAYTFCLAVKAVRGIMASIHFMPSGRGIELSFVRPVLAGDTLTARGEVVSRRPSSQGHRGWIVVAVDYRNRAGETALEVRFPWLVRTRAGI